MSTTDTNALVENLSFSEALDVFHKLAQKINEGQREALISLLTVFPTWDIHQPRDETSVRLTSDKNYSWEDTGGIVRSIGEILDPAGYSFNVHSIRTRSGKEGACIQLIITPLPAALKFYYDDYEDGDINDAMLASEALIIIEAPDAT